VCFIFSFATLGHTLRNGLWAVPIARDLAAVSALNGPGHSGMRPNTEEYFPVYLTASLLHLTSGFLVPG
jgi:hypothetical protein